MATPSTFDRETVRTGLYCAICEETWHPPYAHRVSATEWHVPSSGGAYYLVTVNEAGAWHCDCLGFAVRSRCRHLYGATGPDGNVGVIALAQDGRDHDLPHVTWLNYEQHRWPPDVTLQEL